MQIEINNVKITLTKDQLEEISKQTQKKKDITERIQNFDDVLKELGIKNFKLPHPSPKNKEEKSINAYSKIILLTKAYNEGGYPDFKNSEYKYYPYKYFSGGVWVVSFSYDCSSADFSGGFYFKSEKLTKDAYNKFKDIYEDYWNID